MKTYDEYCKDRWERLLEDMIARYGAESTVKCLIAEGADKGFAYSLHPNDYQAIVSCNAFSIAYAAMETAEEGYTKPGRLQSLLDKTTD